MFGIQQLKIKLRKARRKKNNKLNLNTLDISDVLFLYAFLKEKLKKMLIIRITCLKLMYKGKSVKQCCQYKTFVEFFINIYCFVKNCNCCLRKETTIRCWTTSSVLHISIHVSTKRRPSGNKIKIKTTIFQSTSLRRDDLNTEGSSARFEDISIHVSTKRRQYKDHIIPPSSNFNPRLYEETTKKHLVHLPR